MGTNLRDRRSIIYGSSLTSLKFERSPRLALRAERRRELCEEKVKELREKRWQRKDVLLFSFPDRDLQLR